MENKINEYYQKTYLTITTLSIFALMIIFKNSYFKLYNLKINTLPKTEQQLLNTVYITFSIIISLIFLYKHKNDTLEKLKKYIKTAALGLLTILVYKSTSIIELATLYYTQETSIIKKQIYLITIETIIILITCLINKNKLKENLKDFKKKYNEYLSKYLKLYIITLIIMMISNLIINNITNQIAGNEEAIRTTFNKAPFYMFTSAVIFAPFMEEMVFRNSLKNIITNKKIFIIASGLIFGGLHVIGNINTIYDILYIIPYGTPGIAFAYMLTKTDNILVPMGIHFLHNGLLMTLQIIILFI